MRYFLQALSFAMAITVGRGSDVVTQAPIGVVTGKHDDGIDSFLGIRYATAERFEAADAYEYPHRIVNGTEFGPWCFQANGPDKPNPDYTYSEDCLFLNLWRATESKEVDTKRPVLFYIHRGGFVQGSGADPMFNGAKLAAAAGAVVITVNYR